LASQKLPVFSFVISGRAEKSMHERQESANRQMNGRPGAYADVFASISKRRTAQNSLC
jgi:hypothetical protein